jgi:hypothetical protein
MTTDNRDIVLQLLSAWKVVAAHLRTAPSDVQEAAKQVEALGKQLVQALRERPPQR